MRGLLRRWIKRQLRRLYCKPSRERFREKVLKVYDELAGRVELEARSGNTSFVFYLTSRHTYSLLATRLFAIKHRHLSVVISTMGSADATPWQTKRKIKLQVVIKW